MSNTNKVVKSVAFNKKNPEEKQLLDFVKRRNFSKYIKRLMLDDYIQTINDKMEKTIQQQQNSSYTQSHNHTSEYDHNSTSEQYYNDTPPIPPNQPTYNPNTTYYPPSSADQLSQMKNKKGWN